VKNYMIKLRKGENTVNERGSTRSHCGELALEEAMVLS
jgi:hypothetical protein